MTKIVLSWAVLVISILVVTWLSAQIFRPDDDWEGWSEPGVPYKWPRWGVQPRPLLALIVVVAGTALLIDWMNRDAESLVSAWLK